MVLRRAVEIVGGVAQLRAQLNVEAHAVELWLAGRTMPPESVFLVALDVVLRDDISRRESDRRTVPHSSRLEPPAASDIVRS